MQIFPVLGSKSNLVVADVFKTDNLCLVYEIHHKDADKIKSQFINSLSKELKKWSAHQSQEIINLFYTITKNLPIFYSLVLKSENNLLVLNQGDGQVWLSRGEKKALLASHKSEAKGKVVSTDMLFLFSPQFRNLLKESDLKKILDQNVANVYKYLLLVFNHDISTIPFSAAIIDFSSNTKVNTKPFFKNWITKITQQVKNIILHNSPKKSRFLFILVILIGILISSIWFGLQQRKRQLTSNIYKSEIEEITHFFEEGTALIDLNVLRSRQLLNQALNKANNLDERLSKSEEKNSLNSLIVKITQSIDFAVRKYNVVLNTYFDLTLIKPEAKGVAWDLDGQTLVVLDKENGLVYKIQIAQKPHQILVGHEVLKMGSKLSQSGNKVFVLADDIWVSEEELKFNKLVSKEPQWGKVVDLAIWGENFYLLTDSQIWKYTFLGKPVDQGKYLLPDTAVDFAKANDFAIDGVIWVANGEKIIKLIQGREEPWSLQGLDTPLGKNLRIFTSLDTSFIYILDSEKKRVVVVSKDGLYNSQYLWTEELSINDFAVSEELKKILLLSESKIYSIDVK